MPGPCGLGLALAFWCIRPWPCDLCLWLLALAGLWLCYASDLRLVALVFFLAPDFVMHQALGLIALALAP